VWRPLAEPCAAFEPVDRTEKKEMTEMDVEGPEGPAEETDEVMARSRFLERVTLALGGVIGAMVALPAAGFALLPAFLRQRSRSIDVGPLENFPEGQYVVTTFLLDPALGPVSRRSAFVRNNGLVNNVPSFTIMSSRCTHVGCPTQPNGPILTNEEKTLGPADDPVSLSPTTPSGFGCPCHGSQFDNEGNRTAGPAPRALDRYAFSVRNGHLVLEAPYSVARVDGTGAQARIHRFALQGAGEPVNGLESWLYEIQPPQ
jgi:Rieske Fe-S protein